YHWGGGVWQYYLHYINKSKSWINAMEFCRSRGSKSNLVHITNQTVHVDVTQLIANVELACGGVWIGLERSIFEWNAPWLWTSGDVDKVVKYSEWHSCFPLNPINYHCGKMAQPTSQKPPFYSWLLSALLFPPFNSLPFTV
uniref:C-type lectin domain-containing protein n=1 Tax=Oncorhynchus tshawytscha TaxID=74940 RepID=A0AAZ3PJM6_ONCTS